MRANAYLKAIFLACISCCYSFSTPFSWSVKFRLNSTPSDTILKQIDSWACVKNCGACCKLGPLDSRPDLETYLSPEEYKQYISMIGKDEWCIHFDKSTRLCTNYENRPQFCIVDPKKFKVMYGIEEEELSDFCSFCCREQITDVYGEFSAEMNRFEDVIEMLEPDDADVDEK